MKRELVWVIGAMLVLVAADGPQKAVLPFNGRDLAGWKMGDEHSAKTWNVVSKVELNGMQLKGEGKGGTDQAILLRVPVEQGGNILSEKEFGDCRLAVEFVLPKGGNSGIYFMGRYELQACDSFGLPDEKMEGECGAIMWTKVPAGNACKAPGEWQKYEVEFRAPRFDAKGKKMENAKFVSVILNGKKIHTNTEVKEPTGGGFDDERPQGPMMLQGNEGQVGFRNLRVTPL